MSNTVVLAWRFGSTTLKVGGNYVVFKYLRTENAGTTSSDTDDLEITNYAAGIQHDLSKRTRLWVEYIDKDANVRELNNQSAVSVGMRHDF
jgi:predicted porin